jgi:hypothetical protein
VINKTTLCGLSGLPPTTLRDWIAAGLVEPAEAGGRGPGNAARFTLPQGIGLLVAAEHHRSERGCAPAFVAAPVRAFAAVTTDWLAAEFAAGRTHYLFPHHGKPLLAGAGPDRPDVRAAVAAVTAAAGKGV